MTTRKAQKKPSMTKYQRAMKKATLAAKKECEANPLFGTKKKPKLRVQTAWGIVDKDSDIFTWTINYSRQIAKREFKRIFRYDEKSFESLGYRCVKIRMEVI